MLSVLTKLLGPSRAVSVYIFLQSWGIALALAFAFVIGMGVFLTLSAPSRLDHIAYVTADVTATTPINGDVRNGLLVDLRLPNGKILNLTETEGLISPKPGATACVQHQRHRGNGNDYFRLRLPHRCDG